MGTIRGDHTPFTESNRRPVPRTPTRNQTAATGLRTRQAVTTSWGLKPFAAEGDLAMTTNDCALDRPRAEPQVMRTPASERMTGIEPATS